MMTLKELQSLLTLCTSPGKPGLYRKLYNVQEGNPALSIQNWEDWRKLPLLDKEILLNTNFQDRFFASSFDADHIRVSSGTSGKPPLFSPRTYLREMSYRTDYHNFRNPILAFCVPAMPHWHEYFQQSLGHSPRVIVFDPKNAAASVRLARIAGVDSISVFIFHIPLIGKYAEKEGIGKKIRFIEIAGETCSRSMFEYMRKIFPNAVIIPFYGSSETEASPIGMPCRPITGEEPLEVYHARKSHYHELINPDTKTSIPPKTGAEGELVITTYPGEPSAFPLLRYRTGDMVLVTEDKCEKHGTWTFTILGRVASDFLKITGGVLRADEVERVLRSLPDEVSDQFELHRFERSTRSDPKIEVVLHVQTHGEKNMEVLASKIASLLRVSPQRTYADGVAQGMYLPLICRGLNTSGTAKKT